MGRHGGGSRSGGSSRSSSGGSGGGRSGARSSSTPFYGSYNRSYYDRRGRYHSYYTTNRYFGTKRGLSAGIIFALIFVTVHMCLMLFAMLSDCVFIGKKVDGDINRIFIEDRVNMLNADEEQEIMELFQRVYDKSGMPVTLYTDDFGWKEHYSSLEVYSEELYYKISFDEDAMLILFTKEEEDEYMDWEYDMYCGDDTIKCFSDESFDMLLENFHKSMYGEDLAQSLNYAWNSVMADLAETKIGADAFITVLILLAFYSIFYIALLSGVKKQNEAYKYFKDNPDELTGNTWTPQDMPSTAAPSYGYSASQAASGSADSYGTTSYGTTSDSTTSDSTTSYSEGPAPRMYSKTCGFCGMSNNEGDKVCSFCREPLDKD